MKNLEKLAICAPALLVALSYAGGCGKDSSLHPGASGGAGGGGGDGGTFPGTGGTFPGTGGTWSGTGGSTYGIGGSFPGTGGASAGCAQVASQTACDANPSCYSVFIDPHDCGCAALGCCAQFHHCAEGDLGAQCYGGVSCALAPPFCEGPYVVSYRNDCFEGCVNSSDCAPVCTPGTDETCNDLPSVAPPHGHCTTGGTCVCSTGFMMNPNTGRCL
jgi:hypothetical protein